jgi:hypothetical protein
LIGSAASQTMVATDRGVAWLISPSGAPFAAGQAHGSPILDSIEQGGASYCRRTGAFAEEIGRPALGERGLSGYSEFISAGDSDVMSVVPSAIPEGVALLALNLAGGLDQRICLVWSKVIPSSAANMRDFCWPTGFCA